MAEGADSSAKILSFFHALPIALNQSVSQLSPVGFADWYLCGAGLRLAVYLKGKNARSTDTMLSTVLLVGNGNDIEPFIAPSSRTM